VIIDISLPDRSGSDLAKDLKALSNTQVLLLSPLDYNKSAGDMSISGWLTKPVKSHHLRSMLIDLASSPTEKSSFDENLLDTGNSFDVEMSILLAEDNPVNQKVALSMLKKISYHADVAINGLWILQSLERIHFDVILRISKFLR
jgi:DNA-binding response OmpR family regulator